MAHALIVDSDCKSARTLQKVAEDERFSSTHADSLREARLQLGRQHPDVLLTDCRLPDGKGVELIRHICSPAPTLFVVTGQPTVDNAVDALRAGAVDYLAKPVDLERVQAILRRARVEFATQLERTLPFAGMLGTSTSMQRLYERLRRVAPTSATVLLVGESGTGKELAAQTVHALSRRRLGPFVPVNCGGFAPQLIESELFGHERGSFTGAERLHKGYFERASGGTLFLDEITEMPLAQQVKLLRVLEGGALVRVGGTGSIPADVRVIAATNRDPRAAVASGQLRADLFHRLNVFPIELPPLRERGSDVEQLACAFLDELNARENAQKVFSAQALARLRQRRWPGNVRELRNLVQRAFIMADDVVELPIASREERCGAADAPLLEFALGTPLGEIERCVTLATLAHCGNDRQRAAAALGISARRLQGRLGAGPTTH